jgi:hypothetical protein
MLFLVKNLDIFSQLHKKTTHSLYIKANQKKDISLQDLKNILKEKLYLNIFLEEELYLSFLSSCVLGTINIYLLVDNISKIPSYIKIKSQIIMEDKNLYHNYYKEIDFFLKNKNYIPNIPVHLQKGALRSFIIHICKTIKNKMILNSFIKDTFNIYFYKDYKIALYMLYILNEKNIFLI